MNEFVSMVVVLGKVQCKWSLGSFSRLLAWHLRDPRALFGVAAAVSLGTEEALWVDNRTIVLQGCGGR